MTDLFGFPSAEVRYRADGSVDGSDAAARALAADPGVTDLLVITHGWNNDILGARDLFAQLARSLREVVDGGHGLPPGRTLGILGAIWPSRQFALPDQMQGVAAVGPSVTQQDLVDAIDGLRAVFPGEDARLDRAAALVPDLAEDVSARQEFADLVRGLVTPAVGDGTECPDALFTLPGDVVLEQLSVPDGTPTVDAGLGDFLGGILGGGLNLLNYTTFYAMKERSAVSAPPGWPRSSPRSDAQGSGCTSRATASAPGSCRPRRRRCPPGQPSRAWRSCRARSRTTGSPPTGT